MMPDRKKIILGIFAAVFIVAVFAAGFFAGRDSKVCPTCPPSDVDFSLLWDAWNVIEEKFVDKNLDIQKMIYGAVSGMVESLGDPYTVFFPPVETKTFLEDVSGTFSGIGMEIGIKEGQLQVVSPLEGTPAQKAGLRAGDIIVKINDVSALDLTVDEAVSMIRGPKGTQVSLTIFREEWQENREFRLIRDTIEIPSLELEFKENDSVAYLQLYQFSEKAYSDFYTAGLQILNSSAKKIILDLRNNPGGYLEVAQSISGWFLDKGQVVVIEDFGSGSERQEYLSEGPSNFTTYKMVVLINQGSASAAEILAGALRDNRDILLIGEKSFGKGSVQELEALRDGSSLKVTVAKWLTPKGESINEVGLNPDIVVEFTQEDLDAQKDPQLDKAIEAIKGL